MEVVEQKTESQIQRTDVPTFGKLPSTFELIERSIQLVRARPRVFFGLSLLVSTPELIQLFLFPTGNIVNFMHADVSVILAIIYVALTFAVGVLGPVGMIRGVRSNAITVTEALQGSGKLFLPYLWVSFLTSIIALFGFVLLIVPGVIFAIWYSFSVIALVLEDKHGMEALRRSKELVKGRVIEVFGKFLLMAIIVLVPVAILSGVLSVGGGVDPVIDLALQLAVSFFVTPVFYVFYVLLFDALLSTIKK